MFDDRLLRRAGMEYKAELPCGYIVHYISKETAAVYQEFRGATITAPQQGPHKFAGYVERRSADQ